jgi:hypothetical protein
MAHTAASPLAPSSGAVLARRLVEAGTETLAASDHPLLLHPHCPCRKFIHDARVAVIFYVPSADYSRGLARQELEHFGFSEAFLALWDEAVALDAEFLMLDADA